MLYDTIYYVSEIVLTTNQNHITMSSMPNLTCKSVVLL